LLFLINIFKNAELQFPPELAATLTREIEDLRLAGGGLVFIFGALHPEIMAEYQVGFASPIEQAKVASRSSSKVWR
jgi:hypothetical protein